MKREIKFRAWSKKGKKMHFLESLFESANHYLQIGTDGFWVYDAETGKLIASSVREDVIMQYTGLKDKNGKEIYEGDKIKSGSDIMTVIYRDKIASFALTKEGWTFCHYFGEAADPEHCEVIGNIYENPELIKEEQ